MKADCELRKAIIQYVKKRYEENRNTPSLREISKHFKKEKLNFTRFYKIFPEGIPEAYKLATVPIPTERIRKTEKATNASRVRGEKEKDLNAVEDERVKEVLSETMEWKKKRDKAKALVEAREEEREIKLEALKYEGQLDSRKIPAYLEAVDSSLTRGLLRDLQEACKLEKVSLEEGCFRAVEYWDRNARAETKTFENYVEYCLSNWTWQVRLIDATNKCSRTIFSCVCSECNVKYEYSIYLLSVLKCPNCRKTVHHKCPICEKAWRSQEHLEYDPKRNTLHCSLCETHFVVDSPPLNKDGTAFIEKVQQQRALKMGLIKKKSFSAISTET